MNFSRIKKGIVLSALVVIALLSSSCTIFKTQAPVNYKADNPNIYYSGRIDFLQHDIARLSSAGSYLKFSIKGTFCDIVLVDQNLYDGHSYLAIKIDGEYQNRIRITNERKRYRIAENLGEGIHEILLCKATESANGYIDVEEIICQELLQSKSINSRKIEFIGNSITCGLGNDESGLACGEGNWYDQHNAYWSYAPIAARELEAEWLLSSVSGIGVYRNWNSPGPVMPDVYDNLYLNIDSSYSWNALTFKADLISICLGTNDFSTGDGSYDRGPVDSAKYVNAYVSFINHLRSINPNATIVCLSSPMMSGILAEKLESFITEVVDQVKENGQTNIHQFNFSGGGFNSGCSGHPDIDEHKAIAKQALKFYKEVMNW